MRTAAPGGVASESEGLDVLRILRDGVPRTRAQLAHLTGLSRSTITARLAALTQHGLVVPVGNGASTGGRPSVQYSFAREGATVLTAALEAHHGLVAIHDLSGRVLTSRDIDIDRKQPPQRVLQRVLGIWDEQLTRVGLPRSSVLGVGIAVPGPVDPSAGPTTGVQGIPGWGGFGLVDELQHTHRVTVVMENDANLMAIGWRVTADQLVPDVLAVKVDAGISIGIVSGAQLIRGADGAAGEIGHLAVPTAAERPCRCGDSDCLATFASGDGIAATLRQTGADVQGTADVVALVKAGDVRAAQAVRDAGRLIGRALAQCIAILNPSRVVLGGELAEAGEPLLAGVQEAVYRHARMPATTRLSVSALQNSALTVVTGAAHLSIEAVLTE